MKRLALLLCMMSFSAISVEVPSELQFIVDTLNKHCAGNKVCEENNATAIVLSNRLAENKMNERLLKVIKERNEAHTQIKYTSELVGKLECH